MTKPSATARYNRYVVVEFDSGTDAKAFFYKLCKQMGYDPPNTLPSGTGLKWALSQLSTKHKLRRAR